MLPEEPSLFQLRFTEEGKDFIRKFAAISYVIITLVIIHSAIIIYWDIKILFLRTGLISIRTYDKAIPYLSLLMSVLAIISNIYYTNFPRQLLRSIKMDDEAGANRAFRTLFIAAVIFLIYLFFNSLLLVWGLFTSQV
jgi:hypothetical protein